MRSGLSRPRGRGRSPRPRRRRTPGPRGRPYRADRGFTASPRPRHETVGFLQELLATARAAEVVHPSLVLRRVPGGSYCDRHATDRDRRPARSSPRAGPPAGWVASCPAFHDLGQDAKCDLLSAPRSYAEAGRRVEALEEPPFVSMELAFEKARSSSARLALATHRCTRALPQARGTASSSHSPWVATTAKTAGARVHRHRRGIGEKAGFRELSGGRAGSTAVTR